MNNNNTTRRAKWHKLDYLKYDLHGRDGSVILKAGTPNVYVAFQCGCFTYKNEHGQIVRANKYRDSAGRIYYGR